MSVFTSITAPRAIVPSDEFKTRGNGTDVPAPVGESRITILSISYVMPVVNFISYLWAFVAASILDQSVSITTTVNASYKIYTSFFPTPSLVISFNNISEDIRTKVTNLGFSAEANGRYKYFRGPASDASIPTLIEIGAQVDAYSPYGMCNIRGFAAFGIITRILDAALGFMGHINESNVPSMYGTDGALLTEVDASSQLDYAIAQADDITRPGILFPYFDGLVLPDKTIVPSFIIGHFVNCLGSTAREIMETSNAIQSGWNSLSTSIAGLQISHLVFGLKLAMEGRINVRPILINGHYRGFVLQGKKFSVMKGSALYTIQSVDQLRKQFETLDEHGSSIVELAALLSTIKSISANGLVSIPVSLLSSPRKIHYLLKDRDFNADTHQKVSKLLVKLHFNQTMWSASSNQNVDNALSHMVRREWLIDTMPFFLVPQLAFTKDPILSTLAAFGAKSFSLLGPGKNVTVPLTKSGKMYENIPNVRLEGIPIFVKPVSSCAEDFGVIVKTRDVSFKAGAKDKKGFSRIGGLGSYVGASTPQYTSMCANLGELVLEKKRSRDEAPEESELSRAKKAKKDENRGNALMGLFGGPMIVVPERDTDTSMEEGDNFF